MNFIILFIFALSISVSCKLSKKRDVPARKEILIPIDSSKIQSVSGKSQQYQITVNYLKLTSKSKSDTGENLLNFAPFNSHTTKYLTAEELTKTEIFFDSNGIAKNSEGPLLSGIYQFILTKDRNIYAYSKEVMEKRSLDHTSFLGPIPLASAGTLNIDESNKIQYFDNFSTSYDLPSYSNSNMALVLQERGINLDIVVGTNRGSIEDDKKLLLTGDEEIFEDAKKILSGNFYERLNISDTASPADIKKAYRKMALKWHPDKIELSPDVKIRLSDIYRQKFGTSTNFDTKVLFQYIGESYETLSDEKKRQVYDQGLKKPQKTEFAYTKRTDPNTRKYQYEKKSYRQDEYRSNFNRNYQTDPSVYSKTHISDLGDRTKEIWQNGYGDYYFKTQYKDGSKVEIQRSNGTLETTFRDGRKQYINIKKETITEWPNGDKEYLIKNQRTKYYANGIREVEGPDRIVYTYYPNGDSKVKKAGGYEKFIEFKTKIVSERFPDGKLITTWPNGIAQINSAGKLQEVRFPDGTTSTQYNDKSWKYELSDGYVERKLADGVVEKYPTSGSLKLEKIFPDGSTEKVFHNGERMKYLSNGSVEQFFPDGKKVTFLPGEVRLTEFSDGSIERVYRQQGKTVVERIKAGGERVFILSENEIVKYKVNGDIEVFRNDRLFQRQYSFGLIDEYDSAGRLIARMDSQSRKKLTIFEGNIITFPTGDVRKFDRYGGYIDYFKDGSSRTYRYDGQILNERTTNGELKEYKLADGTYTVTNKAGVKEKFWGSGISEVTLPNGEIEIKFNGMPIQKSFPGTVEVRNNQWIEIKKGNKVIFQFDKEKNIVKYLNSSDMVEQWDRVGKKRVFESLSDQPLDSKFRNINIDLNCSGKSKWGMIVCQVADAVF